MKSRNIYGAILYVLLFMAFGCETADEPVPVIETGTVSDVEGNVYQTVKIGDQWWMAENLKVKKYRNGNIIPVITTSNPDWSNATAGAYCYYESNPDNIDSYGLLYNWLTLNDTNKLAPEGWHIPTDEEWKTLEQHVGMSPSESDRAGWRGTNEGDKIKIKEHLGWSAYGNEWPTNESGFTALAGSCRLPSGVFGQPGLKSTGFWWSLSEIQGTDAWYRYLDYKNSNVFRSHDSKSYGFSVRCVKD
jgi:uncharacterized protein (TIGR02145 family)